MKRLSVVGTVAGLTLVLVACGGDDSEGGSGSADAPEDGSATGGADGDVDGDADAGAGDANAAPGDGAVADPVAPGRAIAKVDGLDLAFELPGAVNCSIADDAITFSHRIGDNEITLGAGVNRVDGGWMGSIALTVANPADEPGPIGYYTAPGENGIYDGSLFAVDGASMSYTGPMLKQPANDGSNPPPVDVGTGTISATCG